jgi:aldose 1-epimerase
MTAPHETFETEVEGYRALGLRSPAGVEALYVPDAGMVCCSLSHDGAELLGRRGGVREYAQRGATMGIPFLHPWANRIERPGYRALGVEVEFPSGAEAVRLDGATGLPIHGLMSGWPSWGVVAHAADASAARLEARVDSAALPPVSELFPFAHEVTLAAELSEATLRITTTVRPTGERAVPIAFGYHPYVKLPGVPRAEWVVALPVRGQAILDERFLPTGREEDVDIATGPLAQRTYDDLFPRIEPIAVFTVEGGGRRISVSFEHGFEVAVVYAPSDDDVICFEPMTAPTNPFDGPYPLRAVEPGDSFSATFSVAVG